MTISLDDYLTKLETTELSRGLKRIGIPRETRGARGPLMRVIADASRYDPLAPVVVTFSQAERLSEEIGRPVLGSGDVLFGTILICPWPDDEPGDEPIQAIKSTGCDSVIFDVREELARVLAGLDVATGDPDVS